MAANQLLPPRYPTKLETALVNSYFAEGKIYSCFNYLLKETCHYVNAQGQTWRLFGITPSSQGSPVFFNILGCELPLVGSKFKFFASTIPVEYGPEGWKEHNSSALVELKEFVQNPFRDLATIHDLKLCKLGHPSLPRKMALINHTYETLVQASFKPNMAEVITQNLERKVVPWEYIEIASISEYNRSPDITGKLEDALNICCDNEDMFILIIAPITSLDKVKRALSQACELFEILAISDITSEQFEILYKIDLCKRVCVVLDTEKISQIQELPRYGRSRQLGIHVAFHQDPATKMTLEPEESFYKVYVDCEGIDGWNSSRSSFIDVLDTAKFEALILE